MTVARAFWGYIETRDHKLMRRVHRWRAPRWFRWWMLAATRLGDGWLWYALGLVLLADGGPSRYVATGAAALAAGSGIALFRLLKNASRRKRPCDIEPHCWAMILPPDQFSFPSGHSITAFAVAVPVGLFYPGLAGVLLFLAASIALSRIILGMHFLSDVLAGSAIGAALGYAAFLFVGSIS
ncbi:MAG TPA: phosphatase PAP2 family protein [Candidatus Acidoferrales bacterium]|jgi:undecaprenyl-diphosphatase|nr:phosphatase PAP2 family protein [Candidatus Acidoferrales bacterium]